MSGLIFKLKNVSFDTGKKYYLDKTINKGTKSLFDVADQSSGGAKNLPAGGVISDLTYNANTGTFSLAKTYDSTHKGMVYAGVKNDGFDINADGAMKVADKHWMLTAWLKITKSGSVSTFNNQIMHFSTVETNGYPNAMLSIVPTTDANGFPTKLEIAVRGKNFVPTLSSVIALFDGNLHQFAVECVVSDNNANFTVNVYIDKVLVYTSTTTVPSTLPGDPTTRRIGTSNPFPLSWTGMFYRARIDNLELGAIDALSLLTADYNLGISRFS